MRIRPKTSEQLRGQAEGFFRDQAPKSGMAKNLSSEAAQQQEEYEHILGQLKVPESIITHPDNAKYQEYVSWLRMLSADERRRLADDVQKNERLYVDTYKQIVHEKKELIRRYHDSQPFDVEILKKNGLIARGGEGFVFSSDASQKNSFVIKIIHLTPPKVKALVQAEAMRRAQGVPHTAQLICYSVEDAAYVMTFVPGETIRISGSIDRITDEQWKEFFNTLKILDDKGLSVDLFPENILFDGQYLNIIDYSLPNGVLDLFSVQLVNFLRKIAFPSFFGNGVTDPKKLVRKLLTILKDSNHEWFNRIKNDRIFQQKMELFGVLTKEELAAI